MTQDEIIRMAREAGFEVDEGLFPFEAAEDKYIGTERTLERFAALVAERTLTNQKSRYYQNGYEAGQHDEREACAKVCEDEIKSYMSKQYTTDPLGGYRERFAAEQCAAAIRSRNNAN